MSWEERLLELFEDLEQQAEGAALLERDAEVAELARAEYSEVDLESRCHASIGHDVELVGPHGLLVRGRVARAGAGWCLVVDRATSGPDAQEWLFVLSALAVVRGFSPHARPPATRPLTGRLGLGSALRSLAEGRDPVLVVRSDGEHRRGRVGRVGKDFLELLPDGGSVEIVPFSAVAALRR